MNVHSDEKGVKYVFALSPPRKKLNIKKVDVQDVPVEAMGRIIKCKNAFYEKKNNEAVFVRSGSSTDNEVELRVIASDKHTLVVGEHLEDGGDNRTEQLAKKHLTVNEQSSELVPHKEKRLVNSDSETNQCHPPLIESDASAGYFRAKRTPQDEQDKRQAKYKLFRDKWLDIDIFREWLDRDPTNPHKARCIACNTTMNAGKSELEKHAVGARHERALEAMQQAIMIRQLNAADAEAEEAVDEVAIEVDTIEDEESSTEGARQMDAVSIGSAVQPSAVEDVPQEEQESWQEQQLQAMNRIATAVESLSGNVALFLERVSEQRDDLIAVLHELKRKEK